MQQMFDLEEDQTELKLLTAETYEYLVRTNLEKTIDHIN